MKPVYRFCLIIIFLVRALSVSAQIVNVESARMQSDTTGWLGGVSAALTLQQSVQKVFGTDIEAHMQYKTKKDKSLWLILGTYGFLEGGGQKYVSNRYIHLRYNYKLTNWLRWEAFVQELSNRITKINSRFLAGTGPRFKVVKNKKIRIYAATLAMYEDEKDITTPPTHTTDIRSSSYLSFTYTPTPTIELISTTFYQPLFRRISDYRVLNQATLKVKATKHFSLSVNWDYLHDRLPVEGVPQTTYNLSAGINYEL